MSQFDLQNDDLLLYGLPTWLPDETLFSLCSRHHLLAGNLRAYSTCVQLFGHPQGGSQHDLPSRIDCFVDRTKGLLGDAKHIIFNHTLLPFYLPFHHADVALDAMAAMRSNSVSGLKFRLGLPAAKWGAHHPLKACHQCMDADVHTHGIAYWHLEHQIPGVWVCPTHGNWLQESQLKHTGVGRFLWLLPGNSTWQDTTSHVSQSKTYLVSLAECCIAIAHLPSNFQFCAIRLSTIYREALCRRFEGASRGLATLAADDFVNYCSNFRGIHELSALPTTSSAAQAQLQRLISPNRCLGHPLRHALMAIYLFGSWKRFFDAYMKEDIGVTDTDHIAILKSEKSTDQSEVRKLVVAALHAGELSASRIAIEFGLDVSTVMHIAAIEGISIKRRPKILKGKLLEEILLHLNRGSEKSAIAQKFNISESSLNKLLKYSPDVHTRWRAARFELLRVNARKRWKEVVDNNPNLGVKAVRLLEPAAYMWLYRNDRAWLASESASLPPAPVIQAPRVMWDARDMEYAVLVEKEALRITNNQGRCGRVSTAMLLQSLPDIRSKLAQMDRLPLTKAAIKRAISTKPRLKEDLLE